MSEHTEKLITETVDCVNQAIEAMASSPSDIKKLKVEILNLFIPIEQEAWRIARAAEAEAKKNAVDPAREAAKRIRAVLKERYPNVKFKVDNTINDVRIRWIDGIPESEVLNAIKPDTVELAERKFSWEYATEVYEYVKNNIPGSKDDGVELVGSPSYGGSFREEYGQERSSNKRMYFEIAHKYSSLEPIADQIKREQQTGMP